MPREPGRPPDAERVARLPAAALIALIALNAACASSRSPAALRAAQHLLAHARGTSVFGPPGQFLGSELPEVGASGLFPVRSPEECEIAILPGGEDSFAARMDLLARAKRTIRIQALIFTGDESGLRVAELLKQKRRQGVDVRVIVDGVSNPSLQTQWMYFDLKQHGIEVEGYEAIGLQLVNEVPLPLVTPHYDPLLPNKRYHEKLWIVDAGTPGAQAVIGGLNIANEYFRVDPGDVPRYWRDQDVLVRGAVLARSDRRVRSQLRSTSRSSRRGAAGSPMPRGTPRARSWRGPARRRSRSPGATTWCAPSRRSRRAPSRATSIPPAAASSRAARACARATSCRPISSCSTWPGTRC